MQLKKIQQLRKKLNVQQRQLNNYYQHLSGNDDNNYDVQAITVKLAPNKTMFKYMYNVAYWRNCWWNQGLDILESMVSNYEIARMSANEHVIVDQELIKLNKYPNEQSIRNELVKNKSEAERFVSARSLQLTIKDLFTAFTAHRQHPKQFGQPKFKVFQQIQPNFKSDRIRIINNRLVLDKPRSINKNVWSSIKMQGFRPDLKFQDGIVKPVLTSFYLKNGQWFANLIFHVQKHESKPQKSTIPVTTGVDLNVHQFVDCNHVNQEPFNPCPKRLDKYYSQLSWTDHRIARRKRINKQLDIDDSNRLNKLLRQRQRLYRQIKFIQTDLCQKYTHYLVEKFTDITIEDLNVKAMKVSHRCKNTQRAMFGIFRRLLTYKAQWFGTTLSIADRLFPSTQRCSTCGYVKTGDDRITLYGNKKHHTTHDQYICYNQDCPNYNIDQGRDLNAEENLNQLNFYSLIARLTALTITSQPLI